MKRLVNRASLGPLGSGLLVGILGTVVLFKDWIFASAHNVLWANDFDPRLIYWIVNWGYHVLFEQGRPLDLWNANSFYPHSTTLAYSDSLVGLQFFFAPLRTLGVSPLASLYISMAGMCLIGTVLTYYALCRIGYFSSIETILIAFCAHFGLNVISFSNHYQLFGFQLAPPFFLYLYLYLREWRRTDLLIVSSLYVIGVSVAMYLAPMLFILSALMCAPIVVERVRQQGIRRLLRGIGIDGIGVMLGCALVLYIVQIRPYLKVARLFPEQPVEETAVYSADLHSIFTGFSKFSFWYGPQEYSSYGAWEYAYFPGFVLLSLSLLYALLMGKAGIKHIAHLVARRDWHIARAPDLEKKEDGIRGEFVLYMAVLFVSSVVLSWGPFYKPDHSIRLPFYYLSHLVLGLESVRAPGRFGMFISLPLAAFSVASIRLVVADRGKRHLVNLLALILIVVESFPKFPIYPFSIDSEGIYLRVSQEIQDGTPLLELPVAGKDHYETLKIAMEQLDGSTIHWGKLVVGYGGNKRTAEYDEILYLDSQIQQERADPRIAVDFALRYHIPYLLIHIDRYSPSVSRKWEQLSHEMGMSVLFGNESALLLRRKPH